METMFGAFLLVLNGEASDFLLLGGSILGLSETFPWCSGLAGRFFRRSKESAS
jgi:hypothetical protein